jgi:hypothetical protein
MRTIASETYILDSIGVVTCFEKEDITAQNRRDYRSHAIESLGNIDTDFGVSRRAANYSIVSCCVLKILQRRLKTHL